MVKRITFLMTYFYFFRFVIIVYCCNLNVDLKIAAQAFYVLYVFLCRSVCWFLYGPFCHGALKLDIYIVYNILSLNISSIYIIYSIKCV